MAQIVDQHYCLGFLFHEDRANRKYVSLIKRRNSGLLNGVGGKLNSGEWPDRAMTREWHEETGDDLKWDDTGRGSVYFRQGNGHITAAVHIFAQHVDWRRFNLALTRNREALRLYPERVFFLFEYPLDIIHLLRFAPHTELMIRSCLGTKEFELTFYADSGTTD